MRIEEVEELETRAENVGGQGVDFGRLYGILETAIAALRAEAWHPIENAEELGAKDGKTVILFHPSGVWMESSWDNRTKLWLDFDGDDIEWKPTRFRFINPPEEA